MVFAIVATCLILAIAYYQVVQGLFNALIMAILAVVCAALALNLYPALAESTLYARQGGYADAVALVALFVLPLLVARVAFDKIIARNVVFGVWADRIGGGALGILAGSVMIGVIMIAMELLPFGESILGYRPFDESLRRDQRAMPFYPDDLTVSLTSIISRGALGGTGSFDKVHDDLLLEAFCVRNTAGKGGADSAVPDSMVVRGFYEPTYEPSSGKASTRPALPAAGASGTGAALPHGNTDWMERVPQNPLLESGRMTQIIVVRTTIDKSGMDSDEWFRLPGTQFRLVTRPAGGTRQIDNYPVGYLQPEKNDPTRWALVPAAAGADGRAQVANLLFAEKKGTSATVWWVYRIADKDTLDYLAFRRVSRRDMTKVKVSKMLPLAEAPAPVKATEKPKPKAIDKPKTTAKPAATPAKTPAATTKPATVKPKAPAKPPAASE